MSRKKAPFRESALEEQDEASSYWAGFLIAHSSLYYKPGKEALIKVDIRATQQDQLEDLQKFLELKNKIYTNSGRNIRTLVIRSNRLAGSLSKFGLFPKGFSNHLNSLKCDRHFWRGVVDSKGELSGFHGEPVLSLRLKPFLMEGLTTYILKTFPVEDRFPFMSVSIKNTSCKMTDRLAAIFLDHLYDNCSIKHEGRDLLRKVTTVNWQVRSTYA